MISKNKKYRTRNNCEWKLYELYDDSVHGAYSADGKQWRPEMWNLDGSFITINAESCLDLIEISPYADFKIDDKVLVWSDLQPRKLKRHFAGLNNKGLPTAFHQGKTSFTSDDDDSKIAWNYCIKYEENNDN